MTTTNTWSLWLILIPNSEVLIYFTKLFNIVQFKFYILYFKEIATNTRLKRNSFQLSKINFIGKYSLKLLNAPLYSRYKWCNNLHFYTKYKINTQIYIGWYQGKIMNVENILKPSYIIYGIVLNFVTNDF